MAGRGPAPKPAGQRARRNADPTPLRVVESEPAEAPELPELNPAGEPWHPQTLKWWNNWVNDPLSADFRTSDWDELQIAAILHDRVWNGDTKVASELRLRTAKFGATAEDRARLRIQFNSAEESDEKSARRRANVDQPVKSRYRGLKAVD